MNTDAEALNAALKNARQRLLSERNAEGYWDGGLSSSALATAVASFALVVAGKSAPAERGLQWLKQHRNADGGWGDTPESPGNFTTTLLCRCALDMDAGPPQKVVRDILANYGEDRTFSVPILTMAMLSGKLGDDWSVIPQLPFELATVPHGFYRFLRLPVVSYALPALIAMGLVRHVNRPARWALHRNRLIPRVLEILREIQPESGGFLEAPLLAGFVAMSLTAAGFREHPVTQSCIRFLETTVREDGSWAIDVNLSTWITSLSVRALDGALSNEAENRIRDHLVQTQWQEEHPFTHAAPGGWGWTNRQGGVPDADDTAAALIALHGLGCETGVAEKGIRWLLQLQNRDGGIPTFCKGWGRLPFDRSCPDLTAHTLRAFILWRGRMNEKLQKAMNNAMRRSTAYLKKEQRPDGSWIPLWFGSQWEPERENPVYGTVRVLEALDEMDEGEFPETGLMKQRGFQWLRRAQNEDGSWGHSLEETALAAGMTGLGVDTLLEMTHSGTRFEADAIGLYFAKLWYREELYPVIFTVEALVRIRKRSRHV